MVVGRLSRVTSEVIRFAPGLKPVLKHQQGGHDQKTHGQRAGAGDDRPALRFDNPDYEPFDLPSGWTERSYSNIQADVEYRLNRTAEERGTPDPEYARELSAEIASYTFEYDGGNGTRVSVYLMDTASKSPDPETMTTMLKRIDTLQEDFPVKDLEVNFANYQFNALDLPADNGGLVMQGSKTIHLRPAFSQKLDGVMVEDSGNPLRDQFMPSRKTVTQGEYVLAHEYGHVNDRRSNSRRFSDAGDGKDSRGLRNSTHIFGEQITEANVDFKRSEYSNSNEGEQYAEAFAEYALTGGTTDIGYVQAYAEKYDWGRNLEKAVDDLGDDGDKVIFVDTFTMNPPPYIIVRPKPAVVKHLGVKHDQKTHGRGSSVRAPFYDDLEDSRREAIEYLTGERLFPPSYSAEGVRPPTITMSDSFKNKVNAVRKKVKAWGAERERRELAEMTPSEVAELAAVNQSRGAKREGPRSPSSWEGLVPSTWVNPFAEPAMAKAADNVLRILYRVFKDVVDEEVWTALVMDPRPLDELDGPLGDLLDDMLDAVAPKPAVVKFAPGLRPVLKHQQGSHDQKTHGTWATGGAGGDFSEWGSRAPQIREIAEVAPPLAELGRLMADPYDAISLRTDDLIADLVEERKDLIESFPPDVTMVNPEDVDVYSDSEKEFLRQQSLDFFYEYGDDFPDAGTKYDALRDYMRPTANFEFVKESLSDEDMRRLRDRAQGLVEREMIGSLTPGMKAVFGISHPVTLSDGSSNVMEVMVEDVTWTGGLGSERPTVQVLMDVYNNDGYIIASGVQRAFRLGTDGKLEVENVYLKIGDDAYRGKGFATVFNERAYDAYISQGVESVTVGTAWDGGFVWANKGFAWDEASPQSNMQTASDAVQKVLRDSRSSASTLERAAVMLDQVSTQQSRSVPDLSEMPTPMEIAMLGYRDQGTGAFGSIETTTWPGKTALYDARWKGRKELTPENLGGIARSKADMRRPSEVPGQKPLFDKNPVVQQPSAGTAGGRQSLDEEVMALLRPIGKAKKLSYWDKIEQQAEFYEKWIMETGRGLEEEDPDSMDDFFAAAVEAMPWLVE